MGAAAGMGLLSGFIPSLPLLDHPDQEMISGRVDLQSFLLLLVFSSWVVSQPAVTKDFIVLPNKEIVLYFLNPAVANRVLCSSLQRGAICLQNEDFGYLWLLIWLCLTIILFLEETKLLKPICKLFRFLYS